MEAGIRIVDFQADNAAEEFAGSLRDIGFAVLKNHPIDNELVEDTYARWHAFFKSPDEEKLKFEFSRETHDGFIPFDLSETAKGFKQKDLKEFYHYYTGGRCPEALLEGTSKMKLQLEEMAQTLLGWVEQHTPQDIREKFEVSLSEGAKDSPHTLFRIIHYPPLTGEEEPGALRAAEHGDINLITLLPAATAKGLQVKHSSGQWIDAPCEPGYIVVNAGDMLQEATAGYYPSTLHRVLNPEGEDAKQSRLSMPLFLHPHPNVRLSERHTAESYRAERFAELGLD